MQNKIVDLSEYSRSIQLSDPKIGLLAFVVIHKLFNNKPSFGATRYAQYSSSDLALADAANLSKLMTYKSVMAGLPFGGAKAVIVQQDSHDKDTILSSYAKFVGQLNREFVTGADIGISQEDVALMKKNAPLNMVGTKVDPVFFTIEGMMLALRETVRLRFEQTSLENLSFAIQGLGKIGGTFLEAICGEAAKIYVTDIDQQRLQTIKKKYPKVIAVDHDAIYSTKADFFCPCAVSHAINATTISKLNCQVILGGANIQLASPQMGTQLHSQNILYIPDYVVNAGGLISVTDEFDHARVSMKRISDKLAIIPKRVKTIIERSQSLGRATSTIADQMADEIIGHYD